MGSIEDHLFPLTYIGTKVLKVDRFQSIYSNTLECWNVHSPLIFYQQKMICHLPNTDHRFQQASLLARLDVVLGIVVVQHLEVPIPNIM